MDMPHANFGVLGAFRPVRWQNLPGRIPALPLFAPVLWRAAAGEIGTSFAVRRELWRGPYSLLIVERQQRLDCHSFNLPLAFGVTVW